MKKHMRILLSLLGVVTILIIWCVQHPFHWHSVPMGSIKTVNEHWKIQATHIDDVNNPFNRILYTLTNTNGREVVLTEQEFDDIEFTLLHRDTKEYLLTRTYGTASNHAYYYQLFTLGTDTASRITKSQYLGHTDVQCLDTPKPLVEDQEIFLDCGSPTVKGNALVFKMPGFSCELFSASGGCPSEYAVSLE